MATIQEQAQAYFKANNLRGTMVDWESFNRSQNRGSAYAQGRTADSYTGRQKAGKPAPAAKPGGQATPIRFKPRSEKDGNLVVLSNLGGNYELVGPGGNVIATGSNQGASNGYGNTVRFGMTGSAIEQGSFLRINGQAYDIPDPGKDWFSLKTRSSAQAPAPNDGKFDSYAVNQNMTNLPADRKQAQMVEGTWQQNASRKPSSAVDQRTTAYFDVPDPYNNGGTTRAQYVYDPSMNRWRISDMGSGRDNAELPRFITAGPPAEKPPAPAAPAPAPAPSGGGGSGGGSAPEVPNILQDYLGALDDMVGSGDTIERDGYGLEDTVVDRDPDELRTILNDQAQNTFLTNEGAAYRPPINQLGRRAVVDPLTGVVYDSPAAARMAGISNWVFQDIYQTGMGATGNDGLIPTVLTA